MSRPGMPLLRAAAVFICLIAGCRSPGPADTSGTAPVEAEYFGGEIIRVNQREGYVVLHGTVLPSEGKEVTVFRGDRPVAVLRITRPVHPPFATADIVEGRPMRGDRIRDDGDGP